MCCVKSGCSVPRQEPNKYCSRGQDYEWAYYAPDAEVLMQKYGIDPCDVPGTGRDGIVTRQNVVGYLKQYGYTS